MKRVLYWTLLILVALTGVIGLLVSLCGGFFTIVRIEYSPVWFALSSLFVGLMLVWGAKVLGMKIKSKLDNRDW